MKPHPPSSDDVAHAERTILDHILASAPEAVHPNDLRKLFEEHGCLSARWREAMNCALEQLQFGRWSIVRDRHGYRKAGCRAKPHDVDAEEDED